MSFDFALKPINPAVPLYATSLMLKHFMQKNKNEKKFCLLICSDKKHATDLEKTLKFVMTDVDDTNIMHFADYETLPYDGFSPFNQIISQRLKTLYRLPTIKKGFLIITANVLMQKIVPSNFLKSNVFLLKNNDILDIDDLKSQLEQMMWTRVSQVEKHGEYAIRGSIIDLYPMAAKNPFRIELFDNEIESIRIFATSDQRTIEKIDKIEVLPAKEFLLDDNSIDFFRNNYRLKFPTYRSDTMYEKISEGKTFAGVEYYIPLFFKEMATIFNYLPENYATFVFDKSMQSMDDFFKICHSRYAYLTEKNKPILDVSQLYLDPATIKKTIESKENYYFTEDKKPLKKTLQVIDKFNYSKIDKNAIKSFVAYSQTHTGSIIITCHSAGKALIIQDALSDFAIDSTLCETYQQLKENNSRIKLIVAPSSNYNYLLKQIDTSIICDDTLTKYKAIIDSKTQQKNTYSGNIINNLEDLNLGDALVHMDYGISRFGGLGLFLKNSQTEFIKLNFANESYLYIPVANLNLISRYTGTSSENAPLHSLGNNRWEKEKKKATKKIRDTAVALLELNAKRQMVEGFSHKIDKKSYQKFVREFEFIETTDQAKAIYDIENDMAKKQPMDRVICGDVGFGKTEVAMRAAFICAGSDRQTIILVPTTLLAMQHHESFIDRFANHPINIAALSRFSTTKQTKEIRAKMLSGEMDIVIGTHKLLSRDNKFKNLGLIVIDEEHRFGVRHKEKLKTYRLNIDILTMTATPIPRTLNFGLSGLKELSIIASPPPERLEIKTFITQWDDNIIVDAINREISRGGLVYFLHNNVQTINKMCRNLSSLLPNAKIDFAHGQMNETQLERVMMEFSEQKFDILVATTIIESGIDIAAANTIIINRADKLGLAQLHQLRGRVGRSSHQAYAYLLIPDKNLITKNGIKRLEAIEKTHNLGAGFTLASHDMEIRGAGEILGEEQSGQMQQIGYNLYLEILQKTIAILKTGKVTNLDNLLMDEKKTSIEIDIPALIPETYIFDINTRLVFYKKIAASVDKKSLYGIQLELIDRFGLLPKQLKNLIFQTQIRLQLQHMNIKTMQLNEDGGYMEILNNPKINMTNLIKLIADKPEIYKLKNNNRLEFNKTLATDDEKINFIVSLIEKIKL
ncbi:MAG: transcription-repair coupling factor [Gammaproteobacteria bacterium]|nr:MAG: transcription-repair coupling factor [Gammaproteobacteria bacterium]